MEQVEQVKAPFAQWAIVELMGHNVIAGHVSEEIIAGVSFLRVDVPPLIDSSAINPTDSAGFSKFFAPSAVYGITPTSEENARLAASRIKVRPVSLYILPDPEVPRPRLAQMSDRDIEGYRGADARVGDRFDGLDDGDEDDEDDDPTF